MQQAPLGLGQDAAPSRPSLRPLAFLQCPSSGLSNLSTVLAFWAKRDIGASETSEGMRQTLSECLRTPSPKLDIMKYCRLQIRGRADHNARLSATAGSSGTFAPHYEGQNNFRKGEQCYARSSYNALTVVDNPLPVSPLLSTPKSNPILNLLFPAGMVPDTRPSLNMMWPPFLPATEFFL